MSVNNLGKLVVIGLSAAWLAGCSTTSSDTDTSTAATATPEKSTTATAEQTAPADNSSTFGTKNSDAVTSVVDNKTDVNKTSKANMLDGVQTVFYFDFDKSVIRPAARDALAKHAQYLIANPNVHAVLEGHTDERGTREYNMALGERRAKAVSRYLTIQGVPASQLETVSFGEEVPVAFGHDPRSWQLNRRVVIRYEK